MVEKKISRRSWRVLFRKAKQTLSQKNQPLRVVVLGVGNELNGDDAAGLLALRFLKQSGLPPDRFRLMETGPAPENFTAPIIRFSPDWVLALDAARLGYAPGQIAWIELAEVTGVSAATHGLPLAMVGRYLVAQTGCQFSLLGIQVAQTGFDQPLTAQVSRAAGRLGKALGKLLP